jgi:hypothetical protein
VLAALSAILSGAWPTSPGQLAAFAAAAVLIALLHAVVRRAGSALAPQPVPVRIRRVERAFVAPRLCDPDAAGRPRPRAPSAGPAA